MKTRSLPFLRPNRSHSVKSPYRPNSSEQVDVSAPKLEFEDIRTFGRDRRRPEEFEIFRWQQIVENSRCAPDSNASLLYQSFIVFELRHIRSSGDERYTPNPILLVPTDTSTFSLPPTPTARRDDNKENVIASEIDLSIMHCQTHMLTEVRCKK